MTDKHTPTKLAISVWKNGEWCVWQPLDAVHAENEPDYLVTIPLPQERPNPPSLHAMKDEGDG